MIITESANIINSLGIESKAKYSIEINNEDDFKELQIFLKNNKLPVLFLGEGTNIIPPDLFNGVVIRSFCKNINFRKDINILTVDSGVNWHELVKFCISNSINGFENLSLIPGSVGAAPIQNIGAYGAEISTLIDSINYFDINTLKLKTIENHECNFEYRNSSLKNNSFFITSINFKTNLANNINYEYKSIKSYIEKNSIDKTSLSISYLSNIVCDIRSSILPDPNQIFNAGSFFKNPIVKKSDISYSFFKSDDLITWEVNKTYVKVGAARLIELVKDKIIPSDNVSIYKNHSLVLVTNGRATQNEVLAFASQIQELISNFFNINLEIEPTVIK
jgi:UDP-N-acetylmuramate dehydrogenase